MAPSDAETTARPGSGDAPPSVVGKVRLVVEALAEARGRMGLTELARATGVAKATVYRLCAELTDWGVIEHVGGSYRLGSRLFELGQRVPARRSLRDLALPYLEDVHLAIRESVHFAVPDGHDVIYIEKITGRRSAPVPSTVADRMPMHCTATGKCFLAFSSELRRALRVDSLERRADRTIVSVTLLDDELEQVRLQGWAVECEECRNGYASVAAPVFTFDGSIVGAISVTTELNRLDIDRQLPPLRTAAAGLTRALGGDRPTPSTPPNSTQ